MSGWIRAASVLCLLMIAGCSSCDPDPAAPVVTIDGVADGEHRNTPVVVTFTVSNADAPTNPVVSTLDGQPFASGDQVASEGAHTVLVVATNRAGKQTVARRSFTLDFTPPVIALTGFQPDAVVNANVTPVITVTETNLGQTEATLDGQPFVSGTEVMAEGGHRLDVTARDRAGNQVTASGNFTIDRTPPVITVTGLVDGERRNAQATVSWTVEEAHPGTVSATLDGQPFQSGGQVTVPGEHVLVVSARDAAGNTVSVTRTFVIDTVPPSVTFESPAPGQVTQESEVPLVVMVSDDGPLGDVKVGGESMARGADGKYRTTLPLSEGINVFTVEAHDVAGNAASATLQVVRDTQAPVLVVTSPEEGAVVVGQTVDVVGTATDATALSVTVGGASASLDASGAFSVAHALQMGGNSVVVVARDAAGNETKVTRTLRRSGAPPTLLVTDPPDGYSFTEAFVTVRGEATSSEPGDVPGVTVDGNAAAVDAQGRFAYTLEVPVGPKSVLIRAVDRYGQSAEKTLQLLRLGSGDDAGTPGDAGTTDAGTPDTDGGTSSTDAGTPEEAAPVLVVESPLDGTFLGGMSFAVLGHVEGGTLPLQVTVNGLHATVSSRTFSASLSLLEGPHTLEIQVTDARGRTDSAQRGVVVDRTAPYLEIARPAANPAHVTESPYLLMGQVGDANLAGVTVNGEAASVVAGGFSVAVDLTAGDNAIPVVATDLAGNRRSLVQLLIIDSIPPVVSILEPLDGAEAEHPIIDVKARVTGGSGTLEVWIGTGAATRGPDGLYSAQVPLSLGENVITVTATDGQGLTGTASVRVRYRDVTQEPLTVTGVDPVAGAVDVDTDSLVSVSFNKAVVPQEVPAHFEVWARGAKLAGGYSVAPGGQTATFVASAPLPQGERVTVKVSGMPAGAGPGMASPFASEFTVRRPMTLVRGVVLDERNQPLSGVKVTVEGQPLETRTGPDGNWALVGVQGGAPVVMRYEGGTTSDGKSLPVVRRQLFVGAEQETVDRRLALVPVNDATAQAVDGATGATVTFAGALGPMKLEVPEGGLAFADGSTRGFLTATEIPPFQRPVPIEDRVSADALWQLGPERVQFLKQLLMTLPNRTGLPAGRMVVLLAFDDRKLVLKRVGLGRVQADGASIVSEGPVSAGSLEYFGYMALLPEVQSKLEEALAKQGVAPGTRTPSGNASPTDGGLGLLLDLQKLRPEPSLWERLKETVVSSAHADLATNLLQLWSLIDVFPAGIAYVSGQVRAPREDQTSLAMKQPDLVTEKVVELPYALPIEFDAKHETLTGASSGETVTATVGAVGPMGSALAPGDNDVWLLQGVGSVSLLTAVDLPFGTTTVTLSGKTRYDTRAIRLKATLLPIPPDGGGAATHAKLTVIKESDSTDTDDPFGGVIRFKNQQVSITSYMDTGGTTNEKGVFSSLVLVPGPDTAGIACADMSLGPRFNAYIDWLGNTQFTAVNGSFPVCSRNFWMYPDAYSWADILVDLRLLYGNVTFKNRNGLKVPATCRSGTQTKRDPETGELQFLSEEDSATTEVHFFREDDLEHPIAKYAVTRPTTRECQDPDHPPLGPHGTYSRIRLGPSHYQTNDVREKCRKLAGTGGPLSQADEIFFRQECSASAGSFLRLSSGERLVVFAVNHATGYAGMTTLTVPSINRDTRAADGTCPADAAAGGPLEVREGGQTYTLSRCTQQELGIPGDIDLYPPEIDVRVKRRAKSEGVAQFDAKHLIRTGGAGTTRDDYLQVTTHWRVRRAPAPRDSTDAGTPDAGLDLGEDCDKGFLPDGGSCRPSAIVDDDADAGRLLEMYCSELAPGASAKQWQQCLQDNSQLSDVPAGAPPLAGQIVRVTNGALEQPAVTVFDVAPGRHTVNVQSALRRIDANGKQVTLNNLVRANYYLHVVGSRLLERDTNGDGYVDQQENIAKPPHFEEGGWTNDDPPGMPKQALYLKNVFKRYDERGIQVDQYDVAREHEFRILDLQPQRVAASQDGAPPRDLRDEADPSAQARDLSYEFLATLLAPQDPGRAGTLSGDYRVRLGTDQYGIDCPIKIDEATHSITATCGGEFIGDILSASDILYIELYLSGNAENVLYRFNFFGLAPRRDHLSASASFTSDAAMEEDAPDGKAAQGRPVSQPSIATFFVEPEDLKKGTVRVCLSESCQPSSNLLKEASLDLQPDGTYKVKETNFGKVKLRLLQAKNSTSTGARRFQLPLPPQLAAMPGTGLPPRPVFLVLESEEPTVDRWVMELGKPQGTYNGNHARAVGQEVIEGVNVVDGHLAFEHVDFAVPFHKGQFAFKRVYNNQDNQPTPMGVGWTHNFDGWILEEHVGRYVAVVNGQGFVFPNCATEPRDSELYGNTLGTDPCKETDQSHGFELTVDAPMDAEGEHDKLTLKTEGGWTFEFNHPAMGPREEGKRRWMLTRFSDGHGRTGDTNVGWTKLDYEPKSDRLSLVKQEAGTSAIALAFTYESVDMDDPQLPDSIRILARARGFKWLRRATMVSGLSGSYELKFEQDKRGNLTRVSRSPGTPFQIYEYDYWPVPSTIPDASKWPATNELAKVRVIHGGSSESHAPVHWQASYYRSTMTAPYKHIDPYEMVSSVQATGMQGQSLTIDYTDNSRVVSWPDGVVATLGLNMSGNVSTSTVATNTTSTFWGSDSRGGAVFANRQVTPVGRELSMTPTPRLVLQKVSLTRVPTGSESMDGVATGSTLVDHVLDTKFGVPSKSTTRVGSADVTVSSPVDGKGDLLSLTLSGTGGTRELLKAAQYTGDGVLTHYVDAQGRQVTLSAFNALGQPTQMTMELNGVTPGSALALLTRTLTYDGYGRLTGTSDAETGAFETFSHDGLGRLLTHVRSGIPPETWTYTYTDADEAVTVKEVLTRDPSSSGTTHQHERTVEYTEGLPTKETFYVGEPATKVERSNEYASGRLVSSTDELKHQRTYTYDALGRLKKVSVGNTVEADYTLDAEGKPTAVKDHLGRTTTVKYDGLGRAVFWDWGDGDSLGLKLDLQGNLVRRSFGETPHHAVTLSELDPLGNPKKADSESTDGGLHEVREYDGAGRVIRREDSRLGLVETYAYGDVLGRLTKLERTVRSVTSTLTLVETRKYTDSDHVMLVDRTIGTGPDARTEQEKHTLDTMGRTQSIERKVEGRTALEEFEYTERGQVWSHKAPSGATTTYQYDPLGNLTKVVDPELKSTTYTLDAAGRVREETGPHPNYKCTYAYDDLGRLTSKIVAAHGGTPALTQTYKYLPNTHEIEETTDPGVGSVVTTKRKLNARDRLVQETVSGTGGSRETKVELEGPWQKSVTVTEGAWQTSTTWPSRDDRGQPLREEERWSSGSDSYLYTTTTGWNGRVATVTERDETWSLIQTWTSELEVDSLGNVVRKTQAGHTDAWLYDAAGRLMKEMPEEVDETTYTYTNGLLTRRKFGNEETTYTHDLDGRVATQMGPDGRQLLLDYWPRGQVKRQRFGKPGEFQTTGYTYDANGALLSVTEGAESNDATTKAFTRGSRGELLSVTPPGLAPFTYARDGLLRLTKVTRPGAGVPDESFSYDFLGRQTLRKRGTAQWQTTWSQGQASQVDPNQDLTQTLLDGRGRVARVEYHPGAASVDNTTLTRVSSWYTSADQPWRVQEVQGSTTLMNAYAYDGRRLLDQVSRGSDLVRFTYTDGGRRKSVDSLSGSVRYGYDSKGRLSSIFDSRDTLTVTWEAGGERLSSISSSDLFERRCYDDRGRLSQVINAVAPNVNCANPGTVSGLHSRFAYTYDGRGNRLSETYWDGQLPSSETTEHGYDDADRLTGVRYAGSLAQLYKLAPDGTRLEEKEIANYTGNLTPGAFDSASASRHWRYGFDAQGGLSRVTDVLDANKQVATYVTDLAGRMVSETTPAGSKQYGWDAAGRLTKVSVQPQGSAGGNLTASYGYGWDGLRRSRTTGTQTTSYVWAGAQLVEERPFGGPSQIYAQGAGLTVSVGGERIAHDGLGSAVGTKDSWHRYDAWGGYRKTSSHWTVPGSAEASLGFTGHSFDADAGLTYAQQRWYSPALGRFLSEDPVLGDEMHPTSMNVWGYANGNPGRYIDPDGRIAFVPLLIQAGLTTAIGFLGNVIYQEAAEGAGSSKPIDWGRATLFGGAAGATVLSGNLFGVGTAASAYAVGGGFDVLSQMIMQGRSLGEVNYESALVSGGISAALGGGLTAGAKSSIAAVRLGTGIAGFALSAPGVVAGIEHHQLGERNGNVAQQVFGTVEMWLGILGSGASLHLAGSTGLRMAGLEVYSKGLGSNGGNIGIRRIPDPDGPGPASAATGEGVAAAAEWIPGQVIEIDPATLRWSQTTAGGRGRADPMRESLAKNGWAGDPIDVVITQDGLATVDHTRAAVALEQGIKNIPVRLHAPEERLTGTNLKRPWNRAGETGETWGDAVRLRGAGQDPPIGPTGSPKPPKLPKPKPTG